MDSGKCKHFFVFFLTFFRFFQDLNKRTGRSHDQGIHSFQPQSELHSLQELTFVRRAPHGPDHRPGRTSSAAAVRTNGKSRKKSRVPRGNPGRKYESNSVQLFVLDRGAGQFDLDRVDAADAVHVVVDTDVDQIVSGEAFESLALEGVEGGIAHVHAGEEAGDGGFSGDAVLDDGVAALDIADHGVELNGGEEVRAHGNRSGHTVVGGDASAAGDDSGGGDSAETKNHLFHLRKDLSF